ncbi:MAG: M48 family metallopeptidase [Bacteroidota bacterium]
MKPETLLFLILAIYVANYALERVLSWLNLRNHKADLPDKLKDIYDAEEYAKSYRYHQTNYRFGLLRGGISFLVTLALLYFGAFGWLDEALRTYTSHPILLPLLFFGVLFLVGEITSIPFGWYHTFVIEERFGFNKTTPKTFWQDKLKSWLLTIIIGGLVMGVLLYLIDWLGANFWVWFWIFASLFLVVVNVFYTTWLLPLFNKLTPLEGGSLREKIEAYSQSVNFPLDNIFVMDGSRRSSKANAFFSGMGKRKKIVLFDTLVDNYEEEQLVAVLAHEVGHYKKRHIIQSFVLSILQTGLILFVLSRFVNTEALSAALGSSFNSIHLNLMAFGLLFSPISMVIGLLMNVFSRKNEFEADNYAATTYESQPLQEALVKLHADTLSNLTPHPAYVFFHYSHPPLLQRINALAKA